MKIGSMSVSWWIVITFYSSDFVEKEADYYNLLYSCPTPYICDLLQLLKQPLQSPLNRTPLATSHHFLVFLSPTFPFYFYNVRCTKKQSVIHKWIWLFLFFCSIAFVILYLGTTRLCLFLPFKHWCSRVRSYIHRVPILNTSNTIYTTAAHYRRKNKMYHSFDLKHQLIKFYVSCYAQYCIVLELCDFHIMTTGACLNTLNVWLLDWWIHQQNINYKLRRS